MTRALPTRKDLEAEMTAARRELCDCEDRGDNLGAELARCRCDELLDRWAHLPRQR
jgi:hypothetical protein